jgi:hypothetical protein
MENENWDSWINALRKKWSEVPAGLGILSTTALSSISDKELIKKWETGRNNSITGEYYNVRGWYHKKYIPIFSNKKVMDIGSGFGMDGITYAQNDAKVTFVDILESNLDILERICNIYQLKNVEFLFLKNLKSLQKLQKDYDFLYAQGSMINAPFKIMKEECEVLLDFLPKNGRWIELAYPRERWINEGRMSFETWGRRTDHGAPWIEWYDLDKILKRLSPVDFEVLDYHNFGLYHRPEFNWFDLKRK